MQEGEDGGWVGGGGGDSGIKTDTRTKIDRLWRALMWCLGRDTTSVLRCGMGEN